MSQQKYPSDFLERLKSLKSKRARVVADHILKHGFITTDDIRNYGYKDPYRPTMDLRDEGIPLESFKTQDKQGRTISAYKFGDPSNVIAGRQGGRKAFSKKFKDQLISEQGSQCSICLDQLESRYLQIDHRIPYQIAGDDSSKKRTTDDYMLLCRSCNRSKSWSCETCNNLLQDQNSNICEVCYWANPDSYEHIALRKTRRLDLVWDAEEITSFEQLQNEATKSGQDIRAYIKALINQFLNNL